MVSGKAEIERDDGKLYQGDIVNGLMDGKGILADEKTEFYYSGSFSQGLFHGDDEEFTDAKGNVYFGPFIEGKRQGWGLQFYLENNGGIYNVYLGEFINDEPYGWGVRRTAK